MTTRSPHGIFKPNPRYGLMTTRMDIQIPKTARLALEQPEWKTAMKEEFDAFVRNKTWKLIPKSKEDKIINTKWVFKIKHTEDGAIQRFKARWVANGMRQIEGCDYNHTLSPVVKANSIRIVLTIAITRN